MTICFDKVEKRYGSRLVLDQFSYAFPDSGIVCLFGRSGCGKSTLLHLLAGLLKPDSGSISGTQGQRIAYVFQDSRLLPWLNARENVEAVVKKGQDADIDALFSELGLSGDKYQYPSELSGGMKRRVALARAAAFDGELYLLDEPFKGLDGDSKQLAMDFVIKHTQGKLTVLVTHDPAEARYFSDEILFVDGPPLTIQGQERVDIPRSNRFIDRI